MNELIKINSNNTVSARELHAFLESKERFSKWFNRMLGYGFELGKDFASVPKSTPVNNGGIQMLEDHEITLDMAKEISMLQRSEKGKQARTYFINCEKKLKEVVKKPLTTLEQLKLHYLALEEQNKELKQVKADVTDLKNNMPLFNIECKDLQQAVRAKGCEVLGGYGSKAYKSNSIRQKVYTDIQHQLKREFGVTRYEAIKRQYLATAHMIVENYTAPTYLINEIYNENNQIPFSDLGATAYL